MSFVRSMKYQIFAAAALLLSSPYITATADPADQVQWSESVPVDEERYPGERVEAYIVDGLLHARRLDQNDSPLWHLILAEADPQATPYARTPRRLSSKCATPTARTSSATTLATPPWPPTGKNWGRRRSLVSTPPFARTALTEAHVL